MSPSSTEKGRGEVDHAAAPQLYTALIEAKKELWNSARAQWNLADFKNWAVIQQIDAALESADGKSRATGESSK